MVQIWVSVPHRHLICSRFYMHICSSWGIRGHSCIISGTSQKKHYLNRVWNLWVVLVVQIVVACRVWHVAEADPAGTDNFLMLLCREGVGWVNGAVEALRVEFNLVNLLQLISLEHKWRMATAPWFLTWMGLEAIQI